MSYLCEIGLNSTSSFRFIVQIQFRNFYNACKNGHKFYFIFWARIICIHGAFFKRADWEDVQKFSPFPISHSPYLQYADPKMPGPSLIRPAIFGSAYCKLFPFSLICIGGGVGEDTPTIHISEEDVIS